MRVYKYFDTIISGGVEISGAKASCISRRRQIASPVIEKYEFVAHRDKAEVSLKEGLILSIHLVLECYQMTRINIIELIESDDEVTTKELASPLFVEILSNLPLIQPNINLIARTDRFKDVSFPAKVTVSQTKKLSKDDNAMLVVGFDLLTNNKSATLQEVLSSLKENGFLLIRGQDSTENYRMNIEKHNLVIVLEKRTEKEHIVLLKKRGRPIRKTEVIYVNNYEFSWLQQLKSIFNLLNAESESNNNARIIIVGERDSECGLLGLVNCLIKEPGGEVIKGVFIQDETAPKFSLHEPLYAEQLQLDLTINVLHPGKVWGSYRHLPLPPLESKPVYHALVNQMV